MTETFGARLRRERERRQISLTDVAAKTKIKASLFEALERDDASKWPSGIFRRSFMRAYATTVGLDADATVREFLEQFPDPAAPMEAATATPASSAPLAAHQSAAAVSPPDRALPGTPGGDHSLRLTLVDTGLPFTGGRFLADARQRWSAAAWDLGSLFAIAVTIFVFMDAFWMPFGVTALCYYVGGILLLGNSPGVCLFAPAPRDGGGSGPTPSRVSRYRPVEPAPTRAAEPSFRTHRTRAGRHREVRG